jgi:hypothetical protein
MDGKGPGPYFPKTQIKKIHSLPHISCKFLCGSGQVRPTAELWLNAHKYRRRGGGVFKMCTFWKQIQDLSNLLIKYLLIPKLSTSRRLFIRKNLIILRKHNYIKNLFYFLVTRYWFFSLDTHYEKQLITPLGYFKFFRPPHCLQQTRENETIATIYSRNLPCKIFFFKFLLLSTDTKKKILYAPREIFLFFP